MKEYKLPAPIQFDGMSFDDSFDAAYSGISHCRQTLGDGFDINKIYNDFEKDVVYFKKNYARPHPTEVYLQIETLMGSATFDQPVHAILSYRSMAKDNPEIALCNVSMFGRNLNDVDLTAKFFSERYYVDKPDSELIKPNFFVITRNSRGGLDTRKIRFPFTRLSDEEKVLLYGEKFAEWERDRFAPSLKKSRGLHILQGVPGTGKTSIVKNWISEFRDSCNFYYVPINLFPMLYSPEALPLWLDAVLDEDEEEEEIIFHRSPHRIKSWIESKTKVKNRVFIIEDAENLIARRDGNNQDEISNLLNLSDGLLGEALSAHLILTINCKVEEIDPAVLRKGRLSGIWKFDKISKERAMKIAESKGLDLEKIRDSKETNFTLSSIFNSSDHTELDSFPENTFGFKK